MKYHGSTKSLTAVVALVALAACGLCPATASAQERSEQWTFGAAIYGWMPQFSGSVLLPNDNQVDFDIKFHTLLSNLDFGGMSTVEAQKGHWGMFADVIYLDLGTDQTTTHGGTIDAINVPVTIDVTQNVDLKGWILTFAPSYRVVATPASTVDVFAGAGMLWLRPALKYDLSADFGSLSGPGRSGSRSATSETWNAVAGLKGSQRLGQSRKWFIPYYANIGTGQSDFTVQVAGGVGRAFSWGKLAANWRYLHYDQKAGKPLASVTVNGPLVGAAFSW